LGRKNRVRLFVGGVVLFFAVSIILEKKRNVFKKEERKTGFVVM